MDLEFELERGDAVPAGEGGDASQAPPQVWRVDETLSDALLAFRFKTEWAAWYGPELAGAAARIGALLARRQAAAPGPHGPGAWRSLPKAWVMPLVRRRRRQLAIWRPAVAAAEQAQAGDRWLLDVQIFWGATSKPGVASGSVVWQPCALREWPQGIEAPDCAAGEAQLLLARQLRGGVGLLVVRPWLRFEPARPAQAG